MKQTPKIKHVKFVRDRFGVVRAYLRRKDLPLLALQSAIPEPGQEAGSALAAEVARYLGAAPAPAPRGTFSRAMKDYELSPDFAIKLGDGTKYEYGLIMKEFELSFGDWTLGEFKPRDVRRLRDGWAVKRGFRAANIRLQVLKNILKGPMIDGEIEHNPFTGIDNVVRPRHFGEPHPLWSQEVVKAVVAGAINKRLYGLARAVVLGRYAGARRSDLVKLKPKAREAGRLKYLSGKGNVPVDIREDARLTNQLDAIPAAQPDEARQGRKLVAGVQSLPPTTLVFNVMNRAYRDKALGVALGKLVGQLYAAGEIDSDAYDLHGLRHTRGVELALAGCTDAEGAAQLGHANPISFQQYRRQADRLRLADAADDKVAAELVKLSDFKKENQA